jgi:hypothetical protein
MTQEYDLVLDTDAELLTKPAVRCFALKNWLLNQVRRSFSENDIEESSKKIKSNT